MATINSKTHNNLFLCLSICVAFFFIFIYNVESTEFNSFSFLKSEPNVDSAILQGDAIWNSIENKFELTKVINGTPISRSIGRVISPPFRIYDSTTGNMANFRSEFTFIIQTPTTLDFADGLAFFLAPADTQPQKGAGLLGLFPDNKFNTSNQIIACEIDTYINGFDPNGRHIGIDVNSIRSVNTTIIEFQNGEIGYGVVLYDASSKVLTFSIFYPSSSYEVSTIVDLKDVLPEFVSVGFSATTGNSARSVQSNDLLQYRFRWYPHFPNSNNVALGTFDVI